MLNAGYCDGKWLLYENGVDTSMRTLQAVFAAILVVILAINIVAIGLSMAFSITFLRLEFYDGVFQKAQFYDQIRQWLFNRVSTELPNGQEALPYLEKAMTEDWLREEALLLGGHLFNFLKGQSDQLPIIPLYKLFDRLTDYMTPAQLENRDKIINYWFGPVPERVRFQDILSVDFFWAVRQFVMFFKWLPWWAAGIFLILAGILVAVLRGVKQSLIWIGVSTASAGGVMLELSLTARWMLFGNGVISRLASSLVLLRFPSQAIELLMRTCVQHFLLRMDLMALSLFLIGAALITFCNFSGKLTVIK